LLLQAEALEVVLAVDMLVAIDVFEDRSDVAVEGSFGKEQILELLGVQLSAVAYQLQSATSISSKCPIDVCYPFSHSYLMTQ